jgi:hypothetical protein
MTRYFCDVCGKEVENNSDLKSFTASVELVTYHRYSTAFAISICDDCIVGNKFLGSVLDSENKEKNLENMFIERIREEVNNGTD